MMNTEPYTGPASIVCVAKAEKVVNDPIIPAPSRSLKLRLNAPNQMDSYMSNPIAMHPRKFTVNVPNRDGIHSLSWNRAMDPIHPPIPTRAVSMGMNFIFYPQLCSA